MKEIGEICHKRGVKLLVDGMQSLGHISMNLEEIPFSYYTISGHKFGATKGVGGVFMRDYDIEPFIHGGQQEWNLRAGTEDLSGLGSMQVAYKICRSNIEDEFSRLAALKNLLLNHLADIPGFELNSAEHAYPGIISLGFSNITGREIVGALSLKGFAISTGSACHANEVAPSRILLAMGKSKRIAKGSIRISMGRGSTEDAVSELTEALNELVR